MPSSDPVVFNNRKLTLAIGEKNQVKGFIITSGRATLFLKPAYSIFMKAKFMLFVLSIVWLTSACDVEESPDQLPFAYVDIEINVNDLRYLELHNKGYIYLQGGLRGLIIVKKSAIEYLAFERNCTFEFEKPCSVIEMHESGFYMLDPCCESTFDLDGNPSGGPAKFNLRTYFTYLSGNTLSIQSEPF